MTRRPWPPRLPRLLITAALVAAAPAAALAQPDARPVRAIGLIDLDLLLDSAPQRPLAQQRLQQQVREAERLVSVTADSLQRAVASLARAQPPLSRSEREVAMHLVRAREIQLEDMVQQLGLVVEDERVALRGPLLEAVRRAVRELRQREGWQLIVDRRALGEVVEAAEAVDVTRKVLAIMRKHDGEDAARAR